MENTLEFKFFLPLASILILFNKVHSPNFFQHLIVHNYFNKTQNTMRCCGADKTVTQILIDYDLEYSCFIQNLNAKTSVVILGLAASCRDPVTRDQGSDKTNFYRLLHHVPFSRLRGLEASEELRLALLELLVGAKIWSVTCFYLQRKNDDVKKFFVSRI